MPSPDLWRVTRSIGLATTTSCAGGGGSRTTAPFTSFQAWALSRVP